jgi:hypothetical protein
MQKAPWWALLKDAERNAAIKYVDDLIAEAAQKALGS